MAKIDYNFLVKSVLDEINKNMNTYSEISEGNMVNSLRKYFDKEAEKELKKLHHKRFLEKELGISTLSDKDFYIYAQDTVMESLMNKAIALGMSSIKEARNDIQ